MRRVRRIAIGTCAVIALAACGSSPDSPLPQCPEIAASADAASAPDRYVLGKAVDYDADPSMSSRFSALRRSIRDRRAEAWGVVSRVLSPVPVEGTSQTVPLFRTFYDREDFSRIFHRLYESQSPQERAAHAPFSASDWARAFDANVAHVRTLGTWDEARLSAYRDDFDSAAAVGSLGGLRRIAMSPSALRHVADSYVEIDACAPRAIVDDDAGVPDAARPALAPVDPCAPENELPSTTASCLRGGFPIDAVTVAAEWRRVDAALPFPRFDTSADAIARHAAEDEPTWGAGDGLASPDASAIYTQSTTSGATFRLAGLHIRTRELPYWMNITLWWSDEPDTDFGADRPESVRALGGPWSHYKMCVAIDFDELDASPDGGFDADHPTLGAALRAAREQLGGASFCSNPYIDAGPGLVRSNCVGCHQQAFTGARPADVATRDDLFPEHGRARTRDDFPADGFWGLDAGDDLAVVLRETLEYFRGR